MQYMQIKDGWSNMIFTIEVTSDFLFPKIPLEALNMSSRQMPTHILQFSGKRYPPHVNKHLTCLFQTYQMKR